MRKTARRLAAADCHNLHKMVKFLHPFRRSTNIFGIYPNSNRSHWAFRNFGGLAMTVLRICALVFTAAFGLSACTMMDPPSRGQSGSQALLAPDTSAAGYNVQKVNVFVPRSLVVSEENSYVPSADIVWHGDVDGDRRAQVAQIVQNAMTRGTAGAQQGRAVVLDVVVTRFHALTEKTRASIGGKHNLQYDLTIRDAATGDILVPARGVNASVRGSGGAQALAEDAAGRTQKVVITEALALSIQKQLTAKAGWFGG